MPTSKVPFRSSLDIRNHQPPNGEASRVSRYLSPTLQSDDSQDAPPEASLETLHTRSSLLVTSARPLSSSARGSTLVDHLLPAFYRVQSCSCRDGSHKNKAVHQKKLNNKILVPRDYIEDFLDQELDVRRLNRLHWWLRFSGLPMQPRPLHRQLMMKREVVLCEQLDMHLVWMEGRIFMKPIPAFLLSRRFWQTYLTCDCHHDCEDTCDKARLHQVALGFLRSYTALICYQSDFALAKERKLLPEGVDWDAWVEWGHSLHQYTDDGSVNMRFKYGELRSDRLDLAARIAHFSSRGYYFRYNTYGTWISDNLALAFMIFAILTVILSAMQVGYSDSRLVDDRRFQNACYGFVILSLVLPLVAVGWMLLRILAMVLDNLVNTLLYYSRDRQKTTSQSYS